MNHDTRHFLSGNEAVAYGVALAKPDVIAAYPITPQTVVVERLSEFVESGFLHSSFMHVESEHSALCAVIGASAVGSRTFTASSSQGLLYMAECLPYAAGGRYPIVMMNACRAVALPWCIYGDQRDSLSLLDSGWIQIYVEDGQEALDMILQAYKLAEHCSIMTPVMVNIDGFVGTHTYEVVEVPCQEAVNEFLPPFSTPNKMSIDKPQSLGFSTTPSDTMEFKYQQHKAQIDALKIIPEITREFSLLFGRSYHGSLECYRCDDAEYVLITLGSITGTSRIVVDQLRALNKAVGLIKIRFMRPFPSLELRSVCSGFKAIGVLEKNISSGYEGTVYTNVNSALRGLSMQPTIRNFVAGIGGRDISIQDITMMYESLMNDDSIYNQDVNFIAMGCSMYDKN